MKLLKIGLTHGDYNGIGYEIILKCLADERIGELFIPIVYGCPQLMNYHSKTLQIETQMPYNIIHNANEARPGHINVLPTDTADMTLQVQYGLCVKEAGIMAARALYDARQDLLEGKIDAVVTAPIHKENTQSDIFKFNGHTDFFAEVYPDYNPLMLFTDGENLRVALATTHIPLRNVPQVLSPRLLVQKIKQLEQALKEDFGIQKPRIALLALNPHAGEEGLLGDEESNILRPVVNAAFESGRMVFGPFPSDGYWGNGDYQNFDATLALYHDQGLIPFKLLAMERGVNITAGLPIVRTSPDHGTAFDIAGKGIANHESFMNAIYVAIDSVRSRRLYHEINKNPLECKYVERGRDNVELDLN